MKIKDKGQASYFLSNNIKVYGRGMLSNQLYFLEAKMALQMLLI